MNFLAYQKNGKILVHYGEDIYIRNVQGTWHNFRNGQLVYPRQKYELDACVRIHNWSPRSLLSTEEEAVKQSTSNDIGGRIPRKRRNP